MKIKKIVVSNFRQFKDLTLDLTYPNGHAKAGQPLDKICFIGQSGTGKTTLLKLCYGFSYSLGYLRRDFNIEDLEKKVEVTKQVGELEYTSTLEIKRNGDEGENDFKLSNLWLKYKLNQKEVDFGECVKYYNQNKDQISTHLIYFPADLKYRIEDEIDDGFKPKKIIDFSYDNISSVWDIVLSGIQGHQEHELKIRQEISRVAEATRDIKKINRVVKKLENWLKKNFNPIEDIADNCLNGLLESFSLKVKTNLDIQKKDDLGFIKIEDSSGNEIPHGLWSTGTKQIILSSLPLYLLKPKDTIILFDEPERSLYPDMQRIIIDHYSSMTSRSQFFYATHSPIIASSFEPWEIVELKFKKDGSVYRELYYEGDNHVDNYIIDPRYLDYDLMLTKIFDLKNTNTDIRANAIVELTMLRNELEKLREKDELKTEKGKILYRDYEKLAKKLMWKIESL